jgi:hypothetical protein
MIKKILIAMVFVLLAACDAYDDMTSMFEKQQLVQGYIKDKKGYETQVGFNINNGVLVQVTVYFQSKEVKQASISELEDIALKAVAQSFKLTPKTLNVAIQSVPDEKSYQHLKNTTLTGRPQSAENAGRE